MALYKAKSKIHGNGLFTDTTIKKDEYIGTFKVVRAKYYTKFSILRKNKWKRAICVLKYANHSSNPNTWVDEELNMWALKRIRPGDEITWWYGGWDDDEWEKKFKNAK